MDPVDDNNLNRFFNTIVNPSLQQKAYWLPCAAKCDYSDKPSRSMYVCCAGTDE